MRGDGERRKSLRSVRTLREVLLAIVVMFGAIALGGSVQPFRQRSNPANLAKFVHPGQLLSSYGQRLSDGGSAERPRPFSLLLGDGSYSCSSVSETGRPARHP